MTSPLGRKVPPPAPPPQPKYRAHPTNPHIRINQQTNQWETIQPLPNGPRFGPWPFPME